MNMQTQRGFFKLPNDHMGKTFAVAVLLCLVCSLFVSSAATLLKSTQLSNKLVDKRSNILVAAGIDVEGKDINSLFEVIETKVVDLASGEYSSEVDPLLFDQLKAARDDAYRVELSSQEDIATLGGRSTLANVYLLREGNEVSKYIFPIRGAGLWGTMYGFIALDSDAQTVSGIRFYEHKETPGLGGEIENTKWQASWHGKKVYDSTGEVALRVIKGNANTTDPAFANKIDGLAGATLTSNGVSNMLMFWLDDNGYGHYLRKVHSVGQDKLGKVDEEITRQINTKRG